jgi:glutathione S-transferase
MRLLGSDTSPFVRKVRVVAQEKKIPLPMVLANVWADDSILALNPLGKIPALVLDDHTIVDSKVIVQYLDTIAPTQRLIPKDNLEKARVCTIEAVCDGICEAVINEILERRFHPEGHVSAAWLERNSQKVAHSLRFLESHPGETFFLGNEITVADISCGVMLGYLDLRAPQLNWRAGHPRLDKAFKLLSARPSFLSTSPPSP